MDTALIRPDLQVRREPVMVNQSVLGLLVQQVDSRNKTRGGQVWHQSKRSLIHVLLKRRRQLTTLCRRYPWISRTVQMGGLGLTLAIRRFEQMDSAECMIASACPFAGAERVKQTRLESLEVLMATCAVPSTDEPKKSIIKAEDVIYSSVPYEIQVAGERSRSLPSQS